MPKYGVHPQRKFPKSGSEAPNSPYCGSKQLTRPEQLRDEGKGGKITLFAFSPSLQPTSEREGWLIPEQTKADLDVPVDVLDLTSRSANVLADLRIKSMRQLLRAPKRKLLQVPRFGVRSMAEVERKVLQYLAGEWPTGLACQDREEKALAGSALGPRAWVDHMLSFLPERERNILAAHYGLWDGKTQTLASIGSRLGVSRERVRQIEARELRRLGRVFGSSRMKDLFGKKLEAFGDQKLKRRRALMKKDGLIGAMADDCAAGEAALAIRFLQKVWWCGKQNQQ